MDRKIFSFGGINSDLIKSAEVFDLEGNLWKNLPDMPEEGMFVT